MQNNNEKPLFDGQKTKSNHRVSFRGYLLTAIGVVVGVILVYRIARVTALRSKTVGTGNDVLGYSCLPMLAVGANGVYHRSISWKQASIVGAITMFFGLFSAAVSIYLGSCSNTLTDAMHLTRDTSDEDNLSACVVAGTALSIVGFAGSSMSWFGVASGWFC
ncbi:hypothetical protein BZL39_B10160 [Zygosaccharomyces parabailii]|nr:hypothetical protein BZL39_B10160 [Zygosaccharomyces parabailii]